jgi:hypothetical protein
VLPGLLFPQPTPSPAPSPSRIGDQHEVTTDQGTFRFGLEGGAIVIERVDPSPLELGRTDLPGFAQPEPSASALAGNGTWALACPGTEGADPIRIVFGYMDDVSGTRYDGPPAAGSFAEDGLWMFVLDPGPIDPSALISVTSRGGGGGVRGDNFDRIVADAENPQPSGCFVSS